MSRLDRTGQGNAGILLGAIAGGNDKADFGAYQEVAMQTIEQYGGNMLRVSTGVEAADADWFPQDIILFEFESVE